MKYVNLIEFNNLLNKFKLLNEDTGGNKSSGLYLKTELGEELNPNVEIAYTDYGKFHHMNVTTPSGKTQRLGSVDQASQILSQILRMPVVLPPTLGEVGTDQQLDGIVSQLKARGISAGWHDAIDVS